MTARYKKAALGLVLALSMALAGTVTSVLATHGVMNLPGSDFELDIDANLSVDDASPSIDLGKCRRI